MLHSLNRSSSIARSRDIGPMSDELDQWCNRERRSCLIWGLVSDDFGFQLLDSVVVSGFRLRDPALWSSAFGFVVSGFWITTSIWFPFLDFYFTFRFPKASFGRQFPVAFSFPVFGNQFWFSRLMFKVDFLVSGSTFKLCGKCEVLELGVHRTF